MLTKVDKAEFDTIIAEITRLVEEYSPPNHLKIVHNQDGYLTIYKLIYDEHIDFEGFSGTPEQMAYLSNASERRIAIGCIHHLSNEQFAYLILNGAQATKEWLAQLLDGKQLKALKERTIDEEA